MVQVMAGLGGCLYSPGGSVGVLGSGTEASLEQGLLRRSPVSSDGELQGCLCGGRWQLDTTSKSHETRATVIVMCLLVFAKVRTPESPEKLQNESQRYHRPL